ncbi:hypothetical protein RB195_024473 [Necator americanus]|uniref:Reverse transcriptase domain-containing protein n=1 Tax=Necator americanus TaxID=51031 RepID=A0ABR1EQJ0_NECAM
MLAEAAEAGKSIRYARRDFANRKTKMTALQNKKGTTSALGRGMEKIIYDYYSDLFDTLARLFTRYLSDCRVPEQWKTSKTVLMHRQPICLLSVIYKLFTRVILNRIEKILDEGQPCEQAGFRKGFSTIDHIHIVSKSIEVSREYKMPLCLTFIDLKKAFDSLETEAVVKALDNQGVPPQYIKVFRELYSNLATGISPFYKYIIIDVKRGVQKNDTIPPKIFTATLENAMRKLEWEDMGVKVDGRQLHHLRFTDDIVLITP